MQNTTANSRVGVYGGFSGCCILIFYLRSMSVYSHVYVCATHVCSVCRGQKRVSDPLEQELQVVMSTGIITSSARVSSALKHRGIFSALSTTSLDTIRTAHCRYAQNKI